MPEEKDKKQEECLECKKKQKDARWRDDFPVNWESDNYVTRREMVKFLALGSLTIAGANAVVAGLPYIVKASEMPRTQSGACLFHSCWRIQAILLPNRRKTHASWCVKTTATWLHILRFARIFPVPWFIMKRRMLFSARAITDIFPWMKEDRWLVRLRVRCHGLSWNNKAMRFLP